MDPAKERQGEQINGETKDRTGQSNVHLPSSVAHLVHTEYSAIHYISFFFVWPPGS